MFLWQRITHWAKAVQTWGVRNPDHNRQWAPSCINLLHYLSIPCLSSIPNHYYKLICVTTLLLCEYYTVQVWHGSVRQRHLQRFSVPLTRSALFLASARVSILSSQAPAYQTSISHFVLFFKYAVWNYAPRHYGSFKGRQLVNFTIKAMAHIGWKMSSTCDFCPSLS